MTALFAALLCASAAAGDAALEHQPVQTAAVGEPITIHARVRGGSSLQPSVWFRVDGKGAFDVLSMHGAGESYAVVLPPISGLTVEYFIEAHDNAGHQLTDGDREHPHVIRLLPAGEVDSGPPAPAPPLGPGVSPPATPLTPVAPPTATTPATPPPAPSEHPVSSAAPPPASAIPEGPPVVGRYAPPPAPRSGRTELLLAAGLGGGVAGFDVARFGGATGPTPVLATLGGGAAALALGLGAATLHPYSEGEARAFDVAMGLGLLDGLALSFALPTLSLDGRLGAATLGQLTGAALGLAWAHLDSPSPAAVLLAASTAAFGASLGALARAGTGGDASGIALASGVFGLAAAIGGAELARSLPKPLTQRRLLVIDASAAGGALGGALLGAVSGASGPGVAWFALTGMLLGGVAGVAFSAD